MPCPNETDDNKREIDVRRRTFIKTTGALAGAGLLGLGPAATNVSAQEGVSAEFTNVRVQEALHAWERGYRGRADRALALTDSGTDSRHPDLGPWSGVTATTEDGELETDGNPFAETGGNIGPQTPKLLGWHNDNTRFGDFSQPRDENSHGTHVASIMAGSGRASAIDSDRYEEDEPRTVLALGDTVTYEVDAEAGTGVFASAYGDAIELVIEGPDGRELATSNGASGTSETTFENNVAETATVHDDGVATYTVHVRAIEGELVSAGRVDRIAIGAFIHPEDTVGDRVSDGNLSLHAGLAPNAGIVSITDLGTATADLGDHAEAFAETFNIRAVNMSWGFVGGLPLGAAGGVLDSTVEDVRNIAEAGVLSVAAAGNSAAPTQSGAPAIANEAISVVATGPRDGIAGYSSGGLAAIDDETDEEYMKPDVTSIGGKVNVLEIAAQTGEPEEEVTEDDGDSAATDADLEPVVAADDLTDEEVTPNTDLSSDITGNLEYKPELADEVVNALTLDTGGAEALRQGARREGTGEDGVRDYSGKAGTSMASPSVCGSAGLVADAMEEDAPSAIALPEPAAADRDDVLRLKQVILATATETALTAAPYHRAKAPTYTFGGRDPWEGFGRTNVGPAIDAVTRDLTDSTVSGVVGLDVPRDERAVAGHVVTTEPGEFSCTVDFSHLSGGNAGATTGDPHLDLFAYDAQNPAENTGDPTIVARDAGTDGDAEVSFSVGPEDLDENGGERVFFVVAKLVNLPGLVTGFDARAHLDLSTAFDAAGLIVDGAREDDATIFTGGQTNRTELDIEVLNPEGQEVLVRDTVPDDWEVDEDNGDVEATTPALSGGTHVYFGLDDPRDVYEELTHFAQAPDDVGNSDTYTFGPIAVTTDTDDDGTLTDRDWIDIGGTSKTVIVSGQGT